jgi:hypothetical protein
LNKFSIEFLHVEDSDPQLGKGQITIGSFWETFGISLSFWSVSDYQKHWKDALQRIVDGHASSCLLTSVHDPAHANFFWSWPLYLENNIVYIHNQILFLDKISGIFDLNNPFQYIGQRETISEEGRKISEWQTELASISEFLAK